MLQALLHKKLKDSFENPHFKPSEDSLTSSVMGLMQYLPDDIFWDLLRSSVAGLRTCRNRLGLSCQLTSGIDGMPPIPGNNLAWKDIVLCQMWKENQKRMRGM